MRTWFLGIACSVNILFIGVANAQITPDSTLPNNSDVKVEGNINKIEGGTTAGSNLFHSFKEFSLPTGKEAHFNNAVDISNIITRVTGKSISDIDGLIKANGSANLFLINPNGIVFGENARLDIGGSFVGSTADAIGFGEDDFFSASNPDSSSLLKVNPNALFFNQVETASIQNNSVADVGLENIVVSPLTDESFTTRGLRVPDGKSLLLVGGNVNMDGGGLVALGGRIELGGLAGTGAVGLNGDGNNLSLSFPDGVEKSDVFLSNSTGVTVIADKGGSIAVNARNLEMIGRSFLLAGIESGMGSEQSRAGDIDVNVTDAINLNNESSIINGVLSGASGQGGDVNISAGTLRIKGGTQVIAGTFGYGKGGDLSVEAQDVQLIDTNSKNGRIGTGLFAQANSGSIGDAGDLKVKTSTLLVQNGAQVSAGTFGQGKGGNLTVEAQDVQLIGEINNAQFPSGLFTQANRGSIGDAGDLMIKTSILIIQDGALVSASTSGGGSGGNLTVEAQDVRLIGTSNNGQFGSGLFAQAGRDSIGDAGNLTVKTNTLLVQDGGQVSTGTFGEGKGGNLTVEAQNVQLIGETKNGQSPSGLIASTAEKSADAGDLTIKTSTLLVQDGAQVTAGTLNEGKGGNLIVEAQDVELIGTSSKNGRVGSGLFTSALPNSTGDAGDVTIKTSTLLVQDGAQVNAPTFGGGKGGNLTVDAQNVRLIGKSRDGQLRSSLLTSAQPDSTGNAGNLTINTDILQVENEADVTVRSFSTGRAGILNIDANSIRLNNDASLNANTRSNKIESETEQATININSQDLIIRRGSNITTNAQGENVLGGNINIDTDILAALENSDISANSENFRGGNVRIEAQGIFGTQFRPQPTPQSDITATGVTQDLSGNVEVITPDTDTNSGLVNLPTIPVETEVAQACAAGSPLAQSRFEITGLRGLPPNPSEALTNDAVLVDLVTLKPEDNKRPTTTVSTKPATSKPNKIVEATGFSTNEKGEIFLVADASNGMLHSEWNKNINCRSLK